MRPTLSCEITNQEAGPALAAWAKNISRSALQEMLSALARPGIISFALGLPAPELFPTAAFAQLAERVLATEARALQYSPHLQPLRRCVVELMKQRGVSCREEQVFLTAGAQQGMSLLARLLLDNGGRVITENFIYLGFQQVLEPFRPEILTVETSPETGMDVDAVERLLRLPHRPAFIYAITDGHNPVSVNLHRDKRERLVELAERYHVPIIEDDAYGFLNYGESASPPLRALSEQWVFYVGSFSKILAPALRAGWVVVPAELIEPLSIVKESADIDTATFTQRLVNAYLEDGQLPAHLADLRAEYKLRRDTMARALAEHFPAEARWRLPQSGFFFWVELPAAVDLDRLLRFAIEQEQVAFIPGRAFSVAGAGGQTQAMRLNFSNSPPERIEEGVARLARVLKEGRMLRTQANGTRTKDAGADHSHPATQAVVLGYGEEQITFRFEPDQFAVLAPQDGEARRLGDAEIHAALDAPIGTPLLEEIVRPADRVVIVVPDATRAAGVERIAPLLVARLNAHGLADAQLSVLVGGGTHRAPTPGEVRAILGPDLPGRIAVHAHDASDAATHVPLGRTSRGTPVELNRRLVEADHVLVVGGISFHYIAGFSGGRKAILPGCAAERSIQAAHLLSFDRATLEKRAGIASGCLDGNPVHQDMEEAAGLLNPSFLVNTVLNGDGEIAAVYAGHWREAHRRGCAEYRAAHVVAAAERRPLVIVSAGGAPRDINLIQSHKAMEHAAGLLAEGGTMIALAKCAGGLGRDDFLRWFVPGGAEATARMLVEDYMINGQTAWGLRRKAERFRLLLVSSLDAEVVRRMGLEPHPTLDSALAAVPAQRGYILPRGLTTLPELKAE